MKRPTTKPEQSVFTVDGTIRADIDIDEIVPERRTVFDALVASEAMMQQAEAELQTTLEVLQAAVHRRAEIASRVPQISRIELVRAAARQYIDERR